MDITDRTVDGQKVVDVRHVPTPLPGLTYSRVVEFILEDGTTTLACTECDFVDAKIGVVRSHVATTHNPPGRKPGRRARPVDPQTADWQTITLAEAVAAVGRAERLLEENESLRQRAKAAERDLSAIRRALGGVVR